MKQLTQNLRNGLMTLLDVPLPSAKDGSLLVKNYWSVISSGTEGKTVRDARLNYINKAKTRQKEVKQIIELAKKQGIKDTYDIVMNKLNSPSALGYSSAGIVVSINRNILGFQCGDLVACGGGSANHAEYIVVPKNLCVKIPEVVDLKHAAFATIAAIAMQGIRQADLRLGENCLVIGLGLIGQITIQMLHAAGVRTMGIDIDPAQVELSKKSGCQLAMVRNANSLVENMMEFTHGYGTDAVIITAGTSSLDPVELAGEVSRRKGKVIIVGAVPTGFSRANYYKKELDLRMSSSYGPGRYDPQYEEKGIDYPIGYVRWTENRNMQAYLQMLADKKLNMDILISHEFPFEKAPDAYQMILEKSEPFTGIVLKYDTEKKYNTDVVINTIQHQASDLNFGFIGAGSFAQNFLLPVISKLGNMVGVATARGNNARNIAEKYGFNYATGDADQIIKDPLISTVFITTRHNLHAEYVLKSLKAGKNVFVEKPLALKREDLEAIYNYYINNDHESVPRLIVGFNRRFAPLISKIKKVIPDRIPKSINYRINAGMLPPDHWVQDPEIGGGRIIGEVCHFIDLCMFLSHSEIRSITAYELRDSRNLMDTISISMDFNNGSIASISYFSNGNKNLNKEYLEVFCGGQTAVLDDFKELKLYTGSNVEKVKLKKQDKGHAEEMKTLAETLKNGDIFPITFNEIYSVHKATFDTIESILNRKTIQYS